MTRRRSLQGAQSVSNEAVSRKGHPPSPPPPQNVKHENTRLGMKKIMPATSQADATQCGSSLLRLLQERPVLETPRADHAPDTNVPALTGDGA